MRPTRLVTPTPILKTVACLFALGAATALGGCQTDPEEKAPQCPIPNLLPDASSLSRYAPGGTDLTELVFTARLLDIKGGCGGVLGGKHVTAHAHAEMVLTRGPASPGNSLDVPYSVGVVRQGQILDARDYVEHVVFPPNVNSVQVRGQEVDFDFPTQKGVTGQSYGVYVFFRLSEAELERNRAQTPR